MVVLKRIPWIQVRPCDGVSETETWLREKKTDIFCRNKKNGTPL